MSQPLKLSPDLQRFAEEQVSAGTYGSVDEVAKAAFSLLRDNAKQHEAVRNELDMLFAEMDEGRGILTTDDDFARRVHDSAAKFSGR